jgi:hypothetical protein
VVRRIAALQEVITLYSIIVGEIEDWPSRFCGNLLGPLSSLTCNQSAGFIFVDSSIVLVVVLAPSLSSAALQTTELSSCLYLLARIHLQ